MKNINKIIISLTIFIGIVSFCFPSIIFGKTMQVLEPSIKDVYKIKFSWEKPNINLPKDQYLDSYRIYYRNNTDGEEYTDTNKISYKDNMEEVNQSLTKEINLKKGSLYNFKIVPVYVKIDPKIGSVEIEGEIITEFLFMTDIPVTASGEDKTDSMTVVWKVPNLNGKNHFFSHYEISFAEILHAQKLQWVDPKKVDAKELVINDEGYASYKLINNTFKPGALYAVKVEPIYNNDKHRDEIIYKDVIADGKKYSFSTTPIGKRLFCYDRAYIKPPLYLTLPSLTDINLNWPSLISSSVGERILKLEMFKFEMVNGVEIKSTLGSLYYQNARVTTNFTTPVPNNPPVKYMFTVTYKDVMYLNDDGSVVGPFNVLVDSQKAIYDSNLNDFYPYRPTIYSISDNRAKPFILDVKWEAFLRNPYRKEEEIDPNYGKYLDKDITYKIWVTDDKNNFEYLKDEFAIKLDGKNLSIENIDDKPYFNTKLNKYYYRGEKGSFISSSFEENKIYYIKIIAVRNKNGQESKVAYGAHYIIPISVIPIDPNMLSKPPLRIKKINGIDDITKMSITIEWDEEWFEVYDKETKKWHSKIGIEDKKLIFGDAVKDSDNILFKLKVLTEEGKLNYNSTRNKIINEISKYIDIPVVRMVSLKGAKYKVHTADFAQLEKIGYEKYFELITSKDSPYPWIDITPKGVGTLEYKCESVQNVEGAMKPISPYVIFIRPFQEFENENKIAVYPSYISATTLGDKNENNIKPVVPIVYPVSSTDTSVTVKWEYIEELKYELRFAETMNSYPNGGILINSETIKEKGIVKEEKGKKYIYFTVENLFPESTYFIWVRSLVKNEKNVIVSEWSNSVEMITKELEAPYAPKGLGLASKSNVKAYNTLSGKNYKPSTKEYLIVEWLKHSNDKVNVIDGSGEDTDLSQPLYSSNINKNVYMLKYNKLIENKRYYIRVKTRLTVSKDKDGLLLKNYTYIAQLSLNEDFKDSIEIEMPKDKEKDNNKDKDKSKKTLYKDSEWSTINLVTEHTDKEYDGDKDSDLYPLPSDDYEILYDIATCTLKYRFRSDKIDASGNKDNNVDQRFISKIVSNRTFVHEVNLSNYNSKTIKNRIVEVPYSIFSTFNERKIDFKVIADNFIITIPGGSIITDEIKYIPSLSKSSIVVIDISESLNIKNKENYVSKPQKLSIKVVSGNNTINVNDFNKPLKFSMKIPNGIDATINNISAYINNENSGGWKPLKSEYVYKNKMIDFSSDQPGVYSIIKLNNITIDGREEIKENFLRIKSKLNILDLNTYNENLNIHANQYNQIIAAVLKGDKQVSMNEPLSKEDYVSLGRSKVLVTGSNVSREAGISSLVKVYELKTKSSIKLDENINNNFYKDIKNASSEYQTNLLKASELGFFMGSSVNPKDNLTMKDLMHILDIILNL